MKKKEILEEIQGKTIRSYLSERYGLECYNEARKEIYKNISPLWLLFHPIKAKKLQEKTFERMREIFDERFKEELS